MNLIESLVDAIVRLEGDALVMHVGEKPYVVTTSSAMSVHRGPLAWGQVELSSRILTSDAVLGMIAQILPADLQQSLEAFGAVEHELTVPEDDTRYTVVAARGGDDVWLELKRRQPAVLPAPPPPAETRTTKKKEKGKTARMTDPPAPVVIQPSSAPEFVIETASPATPVQAEVFAPPVDPPPIAEPPALATADASMEVPAIDTHEIARPVSGDEPVSLNAEPAEPLQLETAPPIESAAILDVTLPKEDLIHEPVVEHSTMTLSSSPNDSGESMAVNEPPIAISAGDVSPVLDPVAESVSPVQPAVTSAEPPPSVNEVKVEETADTLLAVAANALLTTAETVSVAPDFVASIESIDVGQIQVIEPLQHGVESDTEVLASTEGIPNEPALVMSSSEPLVEVGAAAVADVDTISVVAPPSTASEAVRMSNQREESSLATVVPLSRMRAEPSAKANIPTVDAEALVRILRLAANRGAAVVYIVAQSRPMVRVDGEISPLEEEAVLTAADVSLFIDSLGATDNDSAAEDVEWLADVPEVGRVRHVTFRDHRGPGMIFRMVPPRVISVEQLGLSVEIQGLCAQPDGLVIVTGAPTSGKSTLLNAFVDLINHNRSDHVIALESQIRFVHESRRSFVSQREVRGGSEALAQAARRALREDPDVLVIEDISSPDVAAVALEAAAGGRLVFGSVLAPSAAAAIEQLIEACPAEGRTQMRTALAGLLRGVVAQVLLRRLKGGRVAAREVLLNSAGIASLILEGKAAQLSAALSGRRHGMMPLTDSLATLVRDGVVHLGEAYRKAADRDALISALKREGVDTSITERLA